MLTSSKFQTIHGCYMVLARVNRVGLRVHDPRGTAKITSCWKADFSALPVQRFPIDNHENIRARAVFRDT